MRLAALAFFFALPVAQAAHTQPADRPGDFDFYVLSLSWNPAWCAAEEDAAEAPQCAADADLGFIVHGLWPQYEEDYPEYCADGGRLAGALVRSVSDIMPSAGLVRHAWNKHGTCTGLTAQDYLAATRAAFARVTVPREFASPTKERIVSAAAVEAAFLRSNPGLERDGLAISCGSGVFEEVRICLTRDLEFRACREVDERGCKQNRLRLRAAP